MIPPDLTDGKMTTRASEHPPSLLFSPKRWYRLILTVLRCTGIGLPVSGNCTDTPCKKTNLYLLKNPLLHFSRKKKCLPHILHTTSDEACWVTLPSEGSSANWQHCCLWPPQERGREQRILYPPQRRLHLIQPRPSLPPPSPPHCRPFSGKRRQPSSFLQ